MKINTRLSLWYAAALFVAMAGIGSMVYFEFGVERTATATKPDASGEEPDAPFEDLENIVFFVALPAALLALVGGWLITRKALAPVAGLTRAAERVSAGDFATKIPRSNNGDELDRLAEVFNTMTTRLGDSFQSIREFTLHASHELKTPLTVIRGELEANVRDEKLGDAQRERAATLLEEVGRLAQIVENLSLLARADAGQVRLEKEPVPFDALLRDAVEDARVLAAPEKIRVSLDACDPCCVTGDRRRLRQLLLILADNGTKYNEPGGILSFSLVRDGGSVVCSVSNSGAGLDAGSQPLVFDRFFRGDASHGEAKDGCGLGLSIAQWIVTAHGGQISFFSEPAKRTTVTVRLPLATPSDHDTGR